jgi:hypothetical protein
MFEDFVRDKNAHKFSVCPSKLRVLPNGIISKSKDILKIEKIFGTHLTATTDAALEGPMTKTAFNCLRSVSDFNNVLLSFILTGYSGFLSVSARVGPCSKVDHDTICLLEEI